MAEFPWGGAFSDHESFRWLLAMSLLGLFILLFGLVSLLVKERLYLTESLAATVFGFLIGPKVLDLVPLPDSIIKAGGHESHLLSGIDLLTQELARFLIGLQVMSVATTIPGDYQHWPSVVIFLLPITLGMWLVSSAVLKFALGFAWLPALVIGACLAPTDPVLASSVLKGKFADRYIPNHLRLLLSIESGANDGLGLPFLMLPALFLKEKPAAALGHWLLHVWVWEIAVGVLLGSLLGFFSRRALHVAEERRWVNHESMLVFTIALTMTVLGTASLLRTDDFIAVFAAGVAFSWSAHVRERSADSHLAEILDMLFNIAFFVFFGMTFPWTELLTSAGKDGPSLARLSIAALLIVFFRRLPLVLLLRKWTPVLRSRKEAMFAGWFGPMGVGAIFFALLAKKLFPGDRLGRDCHVTVYFVVLASILIHGITVPMTNAHMKKRAKRKAARKSLLRSELLEIVRSSTIDEGENSASAAADDDDDDGAGRKVNNLEEAERDRQASLLHRHPSSASTIETEYVTDSEETPVGLASSNASTVVVI